MNLAVHILHLYLDRFRNIKTIFPYNKNLLVLEKLFFKESFCKNWSSEKVGASVKKKSS